MRYLTLLVLAILFTGCEKSDDIPQNPGSRKKYGEKS